MCLCRFSLKKQQLPSSSVFYFWMRNQPAEMAAAWCRGKLTNYQVIPEDIDQRWPGLPSDEGMLNLLQSLQERGFCLSDVLGNIYP